MTPSYKPTPTAAPTPNPTPRDRWTITCNTSARDDGAKVTESDLARLWVEAPGADLCKAAFTGAEPFVPLPMEQPVIDTLAPFWKGAETPKNVYAVALQTCAESKADDIPPLWAKAAAIVCPTAPHAALLAGLGNGSIFDDGSRVIGTDSPAGTYRSEPCVKGCYWERSSSGGEILANGFVTFAADGVTVKLRSGEGFTSRDCGRWTKQG